jgi:hypothetical protein
VCFDETHEWKLELTICFNHLIIQKKINLFSLGIFNLASCYYKLSLSDLSKEGKTSFNTNAMTNAMINAMTNATSNITISRIQDRH